VREQNQFRAIIRMDVEEIFTVNLLKIRAQSLWGTRATRFGVSACISPLERQQIGNCDRSLARQRWQFGAAREKGTSERNGKLWWMDTWVARSILLPSSTSIPPEIHSLDFQFGDPSRMSIPWHFEKSMNTISIQCHPHTLLLATRFSMS
jgi:hypothetical protein